MNNENENNEEKEYMLVYGFRRFSACKKLGWEKIPCYLKDKSEILLIPIDDIKIIGENSRLHQKDAEFQSLMQSIKENGLLEPIGVAEINELTRSDFIVNNLIENVNRQDITPTELSLACNILRDEGLTISEIAIRLSQARSRIEDVLNIANDVKGELENVTFMDDTNRLNNPSGKIPFATFVKVTNFWRRKEERKKLLDYVKKNELSVREVNLIIQLVQGGMDLDTAIKSLDIYKPTHVRIIFNKEVYERICKKYNLSLRNSNRVIQGILTGEIPMIDGLVYVPKLKR